MAYQTQNDKREAVLGCIVEHISQKGYPPTVREITEKLGWSSTSVVGHYLKALQAEGKIAIEFGKARGITVIGCKHGRYQALVDAAETATLDDMNVGPTMSGLIHALNELN